MAYASFEDYRTIYAGVLFSSDAQIQPFLERASDYLDAVTFRRLARDPPQDGGIQNSVKKCCCALAENLYYYDFKLRAGTLDEVRKKSETSGNYSVTFENPLDILSMLTGSTFDNYQRNTALQYLGYTGLLYRGCD